MQALAIIDMQRWMFRTPERAAQLPALVPMLNRLAARFDAAGHPVFDVRVIHQADRSTWSRLMLKYDYSCMIEGTSDAEPVDGLDMPAAARLIRKTENSAFYGTNFEEQLRALGVEKLLLAGAFIDGCVGLTAADAAQRGFEIVLVEDAIAHCNERRRATMFEWLTDMYELTTVTTESLRAA
jgi:nicotinamidase-related amidase